MSPRSPETGSPEVPTELTPGSAPELFPELTRDDVFRLETRRLWLRWPRAADGPAILRHAGEAAVAEMTSRIPHPLNPGDVEAFVASARRDNAAGRSLTLAITPRAEPGALVGLVALAPDSALDPRASVPELGYWIAPPLWGGGLATEAARALIDAYFAYTPGRAIAASARVVNPGSRRVLEKCGFAYHGSGLKAFPARGGVFPVDGFGLDRRAWESLKAWRAAGLVIGAAAPPAAEAAARCEAS